MSVTLASSCSWDKENSLVTTRGIVFIKYDVFSIPLSLAGLIMPNMTIPPIGQSHSCSETCRLIPPRNLNSTNVNCYEHIPTPGDLRTFVKNQSLTNSFLKATRANLFPSWFNITITDDNEALNRLSDTDYLAKLLSSENLLTARGCESLVIQNSSGHFILLQHNGPLDLKIKNEKSSVILHSPSLSEYYCIAIKVSFNHISPVYIGLPHSSQDGLKSLSFISSYVEKGWEFEFKSLTLAKTSEFLNFENNLWNGLVNFPRTNISYDTLINMTASGQYFYTETSTDLTFDGFVHYNYVTDSAEVHKMLLYLLLLSS